MLYLAQVQKQDFNGKVKLQLLAHQRSEHAWVVLPEKEEVLLVEVRDCNEGVLVLVELSNTRQVKHIHDATPWVLELVEQYLTNGTTPELLQQEVQRAEQWRQSLTLQSQEIGRRALEVEARRDQIQDVEEKLKREKKQLQELEGHLKQEKKQLQELEAHLNQERKRLEDL